MTNPHDEIVTVQLTRLEAGQAVDGLTCRRDTWKRTAEFLESDGAGDALEYGEIEECSDAAEARRIADLYDGIIRKLSAAR